MNFDQLYFQEVHRQNEKEKVKNDLYVISNFIEICGDILSELNNLI